MKVTAQRLAEIQARAMAAEPKPPWDVVRMDDQWGVFANAKDEAMRELVFFVQPSRPRFSSLRDRNVANFCAHARQDVPDLVEDLREARQQVAALEQKLRTANRSAREGHSRG